MDNLFCPMSPSSKEKTVLFLRPTNFFCLAPSPPIVFTHLHAHGLSALPHNVPDIAARLFQCFPFPLSFLTPIASSTHDPRIDCVTAEFSVPPPAICPSHPKCQHSIMSPHSHCPPRSCPSLSPATPHPQGSSQHPRKFRPKKDHDKTAVGICTCADGP